MISSTIPSFSPPHFLHVFLHLPFLSLVSICYLSSCSRTILLLHTTHVVGFCCETALYLSATHKKEKKELVQNPPPFSSNAKSTLPQGPYPNTATLHISLQAPEMLRYVSACKLQRCFVTAIPACYSVVQKALRNKNYDLKKSSVISSLRALE